MNRQSTFVALASIFGSLALALWLGGLIALFISVQTLFRADRVVAAEMAPLLFRRMDFALPALSITAGLSLLVLWRSLRTRRLAVAFTCVLLGSLVGAIQLVAVARPMNALVEARDTDNPQFRKLHGMSMACYLSQTLLIAGATGLLGASIVQRRPRA